MDIWEKGVCYPKFSKGYPKCPVSISLNVCIWPPWQMSTRTFGEKGYLRCPNGVPQVPCAHFPHIFENGQWGKWVFEGRELSGLKGHPKCSVPIHQKFLQMGRGVNWHLGFWGKRTLRGKGYLKNLNCAHFFPNGHWGKMGTGVNGHQMPILKNWGDGHRTLRVLLSQMSICSKCPFAPVPISKYLRQWA